MIPAICFKVFPLFIFIPLLLLVEKRLYKIILHIICAMSGFLASGLIYAGSEGYIETQRIKDEVFGLHSRFYDNNFFGHEISIFIMCFIIICFICYTLKYDENKTGTYITTIPIIVYSTLFLFYWPHPQWFAIITPYLALLVLIYKNKKPVILAEALFITGILFYSVLQYPKHTDNYMVNHGILPAVTGKTYEGPTYHDYTYMIYPDFNKITMTIFITSLIILIALAGYKLLNKKTKPHIKEQLKTERELIWLRPLILLTIYMIPTLLMYIIN